MNINNGGATNLTGLNVVVNFLDQDNKPVIATSDPNDVTAKFFIKLTSSATLPDQVGAGTAAKLRWLIIPAPSAGGADPTGKLFFVGAKLSYKSGGVDANLDVQPDSIRVLPMPQLSLDYFLPYDVYGDDPFTPQIEPPIPFPLGVRVKNSGVGTAHQLKIESSQPKIIDNRLGLLVNFQIQGSEVNGLPATPSLLADFGDIASNRSGVARWIMTCSLYGKFIDFSASFTHSDELGGTLTSLISGIHTHRLIHDVLVDLPGRDNVRDFLAQDGGILRVYESENNDATVVDLGGVATMAGSGFAYTVSVPPTQGFSYAKLTDPFSGHKEIGSVTRADGKPIHANNAWLSSTYLPDSRQWNYFLNIFDTNNSSGASYSVVFSNPAAVNHAPVLRQPMDRVTGVGFPVNFIVQASDADGNSIRLGANSLPAGATFTDNGSGLGRFEWTPTANQTGNYPIQFSASDGQLTDYKTTVITVAAGSLLHDWKNRYWPGVTDLNIVGHNADPDGDGLSNLVEYATGMDPTSASLDGAPEIGTVQFAGQTYLSLSFMARTDDPHLQFAVVAADSTKTPDANWQVLSDTVPADQSGIPSGFIKVTVRDNLPIDGSRQKRFLKLRVTTTEAQ